MPSIEELKRKLLKESSGSIISEMGEENKDWLVSPARDLNRILSGSLYKSVQAGNHTALIGPEESGKSSIMALLLADAQKKGYLPVVVNAEGAWKSDFCERWGLDINNIILINSLWVDEISPKLAEFVQHKYENLAIAVDSIGALELRKVIKDGVDGDIKADQGRLQKAIKQMLKIIVALCKFQNCVAFSAGHFYGNPTGYGSPEEIGGGKYYRLSADTMVSLKKTPIYENPSAKSKKEKGKILGNKINAATLKNRKYPPFQEAVVSIDYQNGVEEMAGLIDVGVDVGLIEKNGSWYSMNDERLGQGIKNVTNNLSQSNELKNKFLENLENYLKTTGYSSVNRELETIEEDNNKVKEEVPEKTKKTTKATTTKKKVGRPKKNS